MKTDMEYQAEEMARRRRDSEARWAAHDAAIEEHRRNGTLIPLACGPYLGLTDPLFYRRLF